MCCRFNVRIETGAIISSPHEPVREKRATSPCPSRTDWLIVSVLRQAVCNSSWEAVHGRLTPQVSATSLLTALESHSGSKGGRTTENEKQKGPFVCSQSFLCGCRMTVFRGLKPRSKPRRGLNLFPWMWLQTIQHHCIKWSHFSKEKKQWGKKERNQ